jgi:hypothetical protein
VLIHQATDEIPQQNATVYSVQPYFLDGVISFHVQLSGAPGGFNLNASTTIAATGIGTDPEPNLVLVPKNMKTRVPKSAEGTAMIIAVTFNSDDTITYHVQLDGTIVKLYGDKYVHDIDLIDPAEPPTLSILTSHTLSHLKRDQWRQGGEARPPMRAEPMTIAKRGIEGISSYTAQFSEETCQSIKCLRNGGKSAMFNPFIKSCYCQTLAPPKSSVQAERSQPDRDEGPDRRDTENSLIRSAFSIPKPSSETCRHLIACQGESEPYFDEGSSQCLCVVYRTGVKEPVITSDTTIFPRAEEAASVEEGNSPAHENTPDSNLRDQGTYCSVDFARKNCHGHRMVGRWNKDHTACVCQRLSNMVEFSASTEHTSENIADSPVARQSNEIADWYLRCTDDLHGCLSPPYHYRCDPDRKMVRHQENDLCEKNCECGGINLAGCLDTRGGCSQSRPDHPGIAVGDYSV